MMKIHTLILFAALSLMPCLASAQAPAQAPASEEPMTLPRWNIKTNLLYDATATASLGVELRTGRNTSLDLPFSYNAWNVSDKSRWNHFWAQPEFRLWTRRTFDGHFFGVHGFYASYDMAYLPLFQQMKAYRYDGWLAGAGASYGYRWNFSHKWALEFTVGVGYAYMTYDKFGKSAEEGVDDILVGPEAKHYFGPTKVGVSLIYGIGGKAATKAPAPVSVPVPVVTPEPQPQQPLPKAVYEPQFKVSFIAPEAGRAASRAKPISTLGRGAPSL